MAKNRNGPTATVTVAFQGHYCRFVDMVPSDYPVFSAKPQLMKQMPPDGEVIDWLKNNFMLKAQPLRRFEVVERVAKTMSLEVVGFDDKEANDQYNYLRSAIDNFCDTIPYNTQVDPGNNWLELPAAWRDSQDRQQYDTARSAIADARDAFVKAYDSFLRICHKKGIDGDANSGH